MAHRRWLLAAIVGAALPAAGLTQPPGGGPGGGGRGMMMGGDPSQMANMIFNRVAGGKDVISVDQLDDRMKRMVEPMLTSLKITNGQITREQFSEGMRQFTEKMRGGGGMPGGPAPGGPGGPGAAPDPAQLDQWAESRFKRMDKDNDGVLNAEEMDDALKSEKEKWDKNGDGVIDLTEYKAYFAARFQQIMQDRNADAASAPSRDDDGIRKPTVYRAGKLPKELPAWFAQLDTDGDAQVGLYEWKKSGRSFKEFKEYDRNGDNFITVDEVLLVERLKLGNSDGQAMASANGMPGRGPGGPAFGGPGGPGFGGPGFGGSRGGDASGAPGMSGGAGEPGRGNFNRGQGGPGGNRDASPGAGYPGMRSRGGDGSDPAASSGNDKSGTPGGSKRGNRPPRGG